MRNGVAPSTWKTYSSAHRLFLEFCSRLCFVALPASEGTLILFVTELAQSRAVSTIRTYLAGVRHLHIIHGFTNPLQSTPRLDLVLKGLKRVKLRPGKPRLPITPAILSRIRASLSHSPGYNNTMLWAACCLAFFGFLRCGEFTLPSATAFDAARHLTYQDIAVDSHAEPSTLSVTLKVSKTDQFGRGSTIYLGRGTPDLCPVTAILHYLAIRGSLEGPLFKRADGQPLTRKWFVDQIQAALTRVGINAAAYSGHSFRIGAATTAAASGVSDSLIKTLGRWSSDAFQLYIRIPQSELASISPLLATAQT